MFINKFVNKLLILAISMGGAFILLGCSSENDQNQNVAPENEDVTGSVVSDEQEDLSSSTIPDIESSSDLAVDPRRCIGCGKCVRVAPSNFDMDGRKAVVVSSELTSQTTQAVKICPTNAITV